MNEQYNKMDATELAQDTDFIAWAKGDQAQEKKWQSWLEQNPEKKSVVRDARQLVNIVKFEEVPVSEQKIDLIWDKIRADTIANDNLQKQSLGSDKDAGTKVSRRKIFKLIPYLAAAALAGFFAIQFWLGRGSTSHELAAGETKVIQLPDNSTVHLNAASRLRYDSNSFADERVLYLDGEAFFEVQKGSSFKVVSLLGEVDVLGTSFNVFSRDQVFRVDCKTGKVSVSTAVGNQVKVITANQGVQLSGEDLVQKSLSSQEIARWKMGEFHFENSDLESVFAEFERQFAKEVKMSPQLKSRLYSGYFKLGSVEEALHSICWPLKLNYKIEAEQVEISSDQSL